MTIDVIILLITMLLASLIPFYIHFYEKNDDPIWYPILLSIIIATLLVYVIGVPVYEAVILPNL